MMARLEWMLYGDDPDCPCGWETRRATWANLQRAVEAFQLPRRHRAGNLAELATMPEPRCSRAERLGEQLALTRGTPFLTRATTAPVRRSRPR